MRKIIFSINALLLCIITIHIHADQSAGLPYSELDLIKKPFPPSAAYPNVSRFNDISEFWSKSTTILHGFHHLYNPDILRLESKHKNIYRMYLFGWANEMCNKDIPGCDAIFMLESDQLDSWEPTLADHTHVQNSWQTVLHAGNSFWDQWHIGDPSIIRIENNFFASYSTSGFDADGINPHPDTNISPNYKQDIDGYYYTIGGAYSKDGINWNKLQQPLLSTAEELGKKDFATNATYHRPSLMYDGDRFKMWFDYFHSKSEYRHSMGYAELIGPATIETFTSAKWIIRQSNDYPAIPNWPNPEVIKLSMGYFSFSDPKGHGEKKWVERKTSMAFSQDGMNWEILGFIEHDNDCDANHIPEVYAENNTLYLFTACLVDLKYSSLKLRKISFENLQKLVSEYTQ